MKRIVFSVMAIAALTFSSCGGGDDQPVTDGVDSTAQDSVVEDDGDQQAYLLPSPLQIAYIFKKSGLKYVAGTTHDPKSEANYGTSYAQSLNLGVFSSDLAYCVLNKQNNEARNYMNAVKSLSDKLGMSTVFDSESLMKRFDENLNNEDSIMFILSELQSKSDEFFADNDRQMTAAVVFSGAWIESMYIAAKVSGKGKDSKLAGQLADQMGILENLIKELTNHESKDSNIAGLLVELKAVHDLIAAIPGVKEMMESDTPSEVKIEPTAEQLTTLTAKLESMRAAIIKG
ncbi:MAG: hypothetical protein IT233_13195 [Bacteroidia bacterium]|nr:hypothetical protein [Bacteroidia bacterium]